MSLSEIHLYESSFEYPMSHFSLMTTIYMPQTFIFFYQKIDYVDFGVFESNEREEQTDNRKPKIPFGE